MNMRITHNFNYHNGMRKKTPLERSLFSNKTNIQTAVQNVLSLNLTKFTQSNQVSNNAEVFPLIY